jgi:hypothetical protein
MRPVVAGRRLDTDATIPPMHADPSFPTESDPHLARLAAVWGLKREDEWFVQRKENMSPWKVFSARQTRDHDRLWLLFHPAARLPAGGGNGGDGPMSAKNLPLRKWLAPRSCSTPFRKACSAESRASPGSNSERGSFA